VVFLLTIMRPIALLLPALASVVLLSAEASATKYSLWIHGRNSSQSTQPGNYQDFSYWGPASASAGVNKRAVNWDGVSRISNSNYRIRDALDCFCTGANFCYVAAHSAGDPQIGYALAMYGGSTRSIKNASPASNGVCGNAGGTQAGWNIYWVDIASGGGGGSELADIGSWAVSDPLTSDLKTATMRALYNHNTTRSKWFYMFAGAKGTLYSGFLPGQDDEALAYHSTGGLSSTGSFCNPGDWFCDDSLQMGTGGSYKGSTLIPKWSYHTAYLRDDSEQYNHYAAGNWAGIVGPVRQDMVTYAY
jgi:hypothetical protein